MASIVSTELQYANKKIQSSPNSKILVSVAPHNGSVFPITTAPSTVEIAIPTGQAGAFLSTQNHCYLAFNLKTTSGATAHSAVSCQGGVQDMIKEIRIFHGAQKIDEVLHYGKVVNMLRDLQVSSDHNDQSQWITKGTRTAKAFGAGTASGSKYFECVVPLVGLLSPQTQKALPLQDMGNDSLRLYITFHEYTKWETDTLTTAPTAMEITNARFVYEQLQFSAEVASAISAETGGVYQINSIGIDANEYTLQSGQTSDHRLIPVSYSQVKSLLFGYYDGTNLLERVKPFAVNSDGTAAGDYYVSIGGVAYPQQQITVSDSGNQALQELMKAVQPLSFSQNNLMGDYGKTDDATNNTFAVGIDLQGYASVNEKQLLQGVNTYSTDIIFHQRFGAGLGGAYKMLYVCLFEKVIQIANRQTTAVF